MHIEMANMLQVTRLQTQGRLSASKRGETEALTNPLFNNFVRPCIAEMIGTAFIVIAS